MSLLLKAVLTAIVAGFLFLVAPAANADEDPYPPPTTVTNSGPYYVHPVLYVQDKRGTANDHVGLAVTGGHVYYQRLNPTTWRIAVDMDPGFFIPSRIGGNSGWNYEQVYYVHTTA
jgi:hypothetical protein